MDELNEDILEMERPSSTRRTLTLRSNSARQMAVNFMPSRQLPHNTLRLRRNNSEHNALLEEIEADPDKPEGDVQADRIVREMEQHTQLMEDNPVSEELRREALRDLPQGLTMKRHVRAKLSASVSLRSKRRPISMWKRLKYRTSFAWKRSQDRFRDFVFSIELWYEAIRNIEGQFGSAVGSYFYFLRWLFVANLLLGVVVLTFVIVPQVLYDRSAGERGEDGWGFIDFISGTGGYGSSVLFYGRYHADDVSGDGAPSYNMPFAYFFTMACVYVAMFLVLCYRTAYSYRRNFIETMGGLRNVFAGKVFCGWDFGIVSHHAAALNAASIYNEFKELLNEQNKKIEKATWCIKLGRSLTNILVNVVVLTVIAALEAGLWQLLALGALAPRWGVLLSLLVTTIVALLPVMFNFIVRLEYYSPRTSLYVTLARTWLLDMGTLMLLFYYWTQSGVQCWENSFGQETYRLVLLDSLVSLFLLPVIEVVRYFIFKCFPTTNAPEFSIAYNSLTLVYNQSLVWLGLALSPALALLVAAKFLLVFHLKRATALRACQPAGKIWRAAQTQTVLYMLVTLSLFTTMFAMGSLFFRTSSKCGPFRGYTFVYEVLTEGVLKLSQRPTLSDVLGFVTRPGVIAFLILFLCVGVYYMRARARARRGMVRLLRRMLQLQARDKDFLLAAIAKVSNGEWMYSPKPEDGPNSHTWKYLNEVRKPSNAGFHFDASRISQRPRSYVDRPGSYAKEDTRSDGETDSSFSWKGSNSCLDKDVENGA